VRRVRHLALLVLLCAVGPGTAEAAPLGLPDCAAREGVHQCSGLVTTWDGVPLDTSVTLPAEGAAGLPLIVEIHGFGNSKHEYLDPASTAYTDNAYAWAREGYAVLTYTARGLWGSCGTPESRAANPAACARGYIHLADVRYEVRDTQELVGRLVDDGVADPARIGVTGDSYGGGQSTMLAALRDRTMLPDGSLVPWRSAAGTPLRIAAAAPVIPWTDLIHAIAPNGRTLTHAVTPPEQDEQPVGVFKTTFANGIAAAAQVAAGPGQPVGEPFVQGRPMGFLAPPGTDPEADVLGWVARADAGEPYDTPDARAVVERLRFRSAYRIDSSSPPPPTFFGTGFTDDLFPVDEVLRFVNRMRRDHPGVPVAVLLGDFGHQRAANKEADRALLLRSIHAWMDRHLLGRGEPPSGVTALAQTCPRATPSDGPFTASTFAALSRGEVRFTSPAAQTISSGGDLSVGLAIDPVTGGGDACAATGAATQAGTATYRVPEASGAGYTLLGAPTVIARLGVSGSGAQVAARLWDMGGDTQTLVARGTYRPTGSDEETFQLHANGWRFAPGHVPKLELLASDAPFKRPSNGSFEIRVERLELRLPVRERPDCRVVLPKAAPVVPDGQTLAPGVRAGAAAGCAGAGGGAGGRTPRLRLRLRCTARGLRARALVSRARHVDFSVRGRRVARDRRAPFTAVVLRGRRARSRPRITATASFTGARRVTASRRAPGCRSRSGPAFTG
jgi:dienelactone hydrolase